MREPDRRLSLRKQLGVVQASVRDRSVDSISPPPSQRARPDTNLGTSTPNRSSSEELPVPDVRAGCSSNARANPASLTTAALSLMATLQAHDESGFRRTSVEGMADNFNKFFLELKHDHEKLVSLALSSTRVADHRVRHGKDLFAGLRNEPALEAGAGTWRIPSIVSSPSNDPCRFSANICCSCIIVRAKKKNARSTIPSSESRRPKNESHNIVFIMYQSTATF